MDGTATPLTLGDYLAVCIHYPAVSQHFYLDPAWPGRSPWTTLDLKLTNWIGQNHRRSNELGKLHWRVL